MDNSFENENDIINNLIHLGKKGKHDIINNIINKKIVNNNIYSNDYIYENIAYNNKFDVCYNIIYGSDSDDFKREFAEKMLEVWVNYYIENKTETLKEQCKFFINFITEDIHLLIKKIINNDINRLLIVYKLFDYNYILNIKDKLFFNDVMCNDFMISRFGHYTKETVNKLLIDMAVNYYFLNENIIEWLVNNYYNYIKSNIEFTIIEIIKYKNYSNIDNAYCIIEYLLKNIEMNNKTKLNIFKKSIYYNNKFVFELFTNNIFDELNSNDIFKIVCFNVNPNVEIKDTLVVDSYNNYNNNININFYNKLKAKGQYNVVRWFDKYFDNNFNPLIDVFFIGNNINIKKVEKNEDCIICYENKDKIISLSCHSTHNICEDCIKLWYKTNTSCPMCRTSINFSKCNEYITV